MKRSKKILLGLASTIFALVCCFTMASCEVNSVKFKVDFDSNGGSEVADIEIDKDAKITMPENPTRTGYTFVGWFIDDVEFSATTPITSDVKIVAKWSANSYSVTLNKDGGVVTTDLTTYTYGVGATLPVPTKDGYTFGGWFDNDGFTGNAVTSIGATELENKVFYAKWTANTYTVTLNYNDATSNGTPLTSYTYGVGATLPTDAQKTDYELKGWYDNAEFTGDAITAISATDTGNKTYFAKWGLPTFEVSINLDGGAFADATAEGIVEGVKSVEINTKVSEIFTTNPAKDGFNFVRWQYADGSEIGSNDTVTEAIEIKAFFRSTSLLADFELNNDGTTRFGMENATALVQGQGTSEVSNDWASTGSYSLKITQPDTNSWAGLQYSSEVTVEGGFNVVRFSLKSSKKVSNFVIEFYSNGWKASNKIVVEEGEGTYFAKLSAKITSFTKFEVYTVAGITYYIDDITFATAYEHAEGTVADFEFDGIEENYTSGATYYNNAGNISISDEWSVGEGSKYSLKIECDGDAWAGIKMPSYTTKIFDTISFDLKSSVEISQYTIEFQNGTYAWYEFKVDVKVGENHFDIDLEKFYPGFDTIEFYVNSAYGTLYIDNIKLTCSEALPAYQRAEGTIADFEPNGDILLYGYGHDGFTFNNSVAYNSISNEWSSTGLFSFKVRSQNDGWSGLNSTTGIAVPAFDTISFKVYATVAVTGWAFDLKITSTGGWKEFTVDLVEGENTITHTFDNKYAVYYGFECGSKSAYGTFYIDDIVLTDSNPIIFERPVGSVGDFEKNGDVTNYGFSDGYSAYEDGSACEVSVTTEWANTGSYSLKVKTTGNGWAGIQASAKDAPFAYNMVKFTMKSPVAHSQTEFYLMSGSTWILFNVDIEEGVHTYVCELPSTYTQYNSFLFKADTSWNAGQTFYVDDIILINFTRQAGSVGDFEKNGDVANFGFSDGYESYAATVSQVSVTNEWANTGAYSLKVIPIGGGWAGIKCAAKNAPLEYNIVTFTMKSPIAHSNTTFYVMSGTAWPVFKVDIEEGVHTYVCKLDNTYSKYNAFIFEAGEWNNGLVFYIDDIILSNSTASTTFERQTGSVGDYEQNGEIDHYGYDGFVKYNESAGNITVSDEWSNTGDYSLKFNPLSTQGDWLGIKASSGNGIAITYNTVTFTMNSEIDMTGLQFYIYGASNQYKLFTLDIQKGVHTYTANLGVEYASYYSFMFKADSTNAGKIFYIDDIILTKVDA